MTGGSQCAFARSDRWAWLCGSSRRTPVYRKPACDRLATFVRDNVHHVMPLGHVVATMARHGGCERDRSCHLFQRSKRDATQTVLLVDDLALLGNTQAAVDRARRCAENGDMRLAAAAANRAATAMKQRELDILGLIALTSTSWAFWIAQRDEARPPSLLLSE